MLERFVKDMNLVYSFWGWSNSTTQGSRCRYIERIEIGGRLLSAASKASSFHNPTPLTMLMFIGPLKALGMEYYLPALALETNVGTYATSP